MVVNSTIDVVVPILNVTNQDINISNSTNITQPINITIIANLTTPNITLVIDTTTTVIKNGSLTNQTMIDEDESLGERGNKVKGAIIGSVLGFIGLCVCTCVFSTRLRRWCRNFITGHETEED